MFARFEFLRRACAALALLTLAACDVSLPSGPGGGGQTIDPGAPINVALLVPGGSANETDNLLAANLENAARLAAADVQGAQINLTVYNTAGNAQQAAAMALQAANNGAQIIVGPLFSEAANAAGIAVAGQDINVLSFSNNTSIAGGNVFVLGATFDNTANRLVRYATRQGQNNFLVTYGQDLQGEVGRAAVEQAVVRNGGRVVGLQPYALTQNDVVAAGPAIAAAVASTGADAVVSTAGVNAELPMLSTGMVDNGIDPSATQLIGLTRWDALPQALTLPGLQGGLFAIPDQAAQSSFESRYASVYGTSPHPLAGLAYDGVAAIGALAARGDRNALTRGSLTRRAGFTGTSGVFRLNADGTNQRALSVAQIVNGQVVILDPAPRSFGGGGS